MIKQRNAKKKVRELILYSDGGSVNNGRKDKNKDVYGSYCTLIVGPKSKKVKKQFCEVKEDVTNNQMELQGFITGAEYLTKLFKEKHKDELLYVTVISDSQYLIKGCHEWMPNWKKRNWRNSSGKEVENREMWEHIDNLLDNKQISYEFKWVRGHKGKSTTIEEDMDSYYNEQCDSILSEALKEFR